jgi:hypothetical protein
MADYVPGPMPGTEQDTGTFSLPQTYSFQKRKVASGSEALIGTKPVYDPKYFTKRGNELYYSGPQLVDEKGVIDRDAYGGSSDKLNTESYQFLASIANPAERRAFLNELYDRGLYGSSKPSKGMFDSQDREAVGYYLLAMDRYGTTAGAGLGLFRQEYPGGQSAGGGARIKVTAREDVEKVLREESLRLLGRSMTANEIRQAVQFVQGQQVQRASAGMDVPSLGTQAEVAVQQGRGTEVAVQGAARMAEILEGLIGR